MSSVILSGQDLGGNRERLLRQEPVRESRHEPEHRVDLRGIFKGIIAFLLLVLAGELVFHFAVAPRLTITSVKLKVPAGFEISDSELLTRAGLTGEISYFAVDPEAVSRAILTIPVVRDVLVEKQFPNALSITVFDRKPLALALAVRNGKTVPVLFDRDGVVFSIGGEIDEYELPVFSGLTFSSIELGMTLPEAMLPLLQDIESIRKSAPVFFSMISEMSIVSRQGEGFDVLMYPVHFKTRVRLSERISKEQIEYAFMMVDLARRMGITRDLEEIDMRTGEPVNRFKTEGADAF